MSPQLSCGTPGKYERDSKYLTYTSAKDKISRNEEINEESFSNLHIWTTVAYLEKDYWTAGGWHNLIRNVNNNKFNGGFS